MIEIFYIARSSRFFHYVFLGGTHRVVLDVRRRSAGVEKRSGRQERQSEPGFAGIIELTRCEGLG
ncbi:MAG TPA: hypothetical protein VJ836_05925 [Candidatus Saccharimonadales bacterium]|nr:hypothetical protein [Candidatus Saccharimonadales bacterium]